MIALLVAAALAPRVVHVSARKFSFTPATIELKRGEPVVLELTSEDRVHGFKVPGLGVDVQIEPGKTTRVKLAPRRAGSFAFHCDVFCGSGHEDMEGVIVIR